MTDQKRPITPPTELLEQWEDDILNERDNVDHVLDCAWQNGFQAGADAELEACCDVIACWLNDFDGGYIAGQLRTERRPTKPPSLKEQALARTDAILNDPNRALLVEVRETLEMNRRALEQLKDD